MAEMTEQGRPVEARAAVVPPERHHSLGMRAFRRTRVLIVLAVTVLIWEIATRALDIPVYLLPAPELLIADVVEKPGVVLDAFVATSIAAVLGFLFAAALGIGLGIVIARWFVMEELLYPYLNIIRVTPIIAIAPLLTIWFGHGRTPVVIVAVIIAFFPIVVGTVLGLKSVDPDLINLMRTLSASDRVILRKIRLPHAMPYIFSAFRISAPLAVIGTLVAEFVGGSSGLGYLLITARGRIDTSMVFLMVVLSALLGIAFFQVVVAIERRVIRWHPSVVQD
jgi:ABC-type nitrate/sulfonate/bicarbonate transport system permease component